MWAEFLQEHSKRGENIITVDSTLFKWGLLRVETDVVKFPLLSLFCREENREGDTCNFNTLHNY